MKDNDCELSSIDVLYNGNRNALSYFTTYLTTPQIHDSLFET